jgi:hypothetical protein
MKHGRTVESFGERSPLLGSECKGGLIGDHLLGPRASAFEDEVSHIHAPDLSAGANESFLRGSCAQVYAAAASLLRDCHLDVVLTMYSEYKS